MRNDVCAALRALSPSPQPRPRLFCGPEEVVALRARAADQPGMLAQVRARAAEIMATPGGDVDVLQPYRSGADGVTVAQAILLTDDEAASPWVKERINGLLALDTWLSPVHVGVCHVCDHVMANVGSQIAQMVDALGDAWTPEELAEVQAGLERLLFAPYLLATGEQREFWFDPAYLYNWKIMTCGETGLAACAFAESLPDAGEILARSAQGVLEILDVVPPEGDWPEGIGYWSATLRFGLQFAWALRRRTGGAVDLFQHPALQRTGDFLSLLTTPGGYVHNFSDCDPEVTPGLSEVLAVLGSATGRGDWLAVARAHPAPTLPYVAALDPTIADAPLPRTVAAFATTGVATMRAGTTFVGLRSGSPRAAHSHLDANSFVVEAGGAPLIVDYRYWPQAHFLGYFDGSGPRWNFDGLATIGHSTLLVDGQGQDCEVGEGGRIVEATDHGTWARLVAEAGGAPATAGAYPGLLRQFTRSLLLVKPDVIVIRDVIVCEGERNLEWLLHHAGTVTSVGRDSFIEHEGVRLAVTPFLPDRAMGWRVSDVARASTYECSDTRQEVTMTVRYRSFSAFRPAASAEFLFGLRVNGAGGEDWSFTTSANGWELRVAGTEGVIVPEQDTLRLDRGLSSPQV